ncbi:MAG: hypothetical protein IKJ01_02480 [Lachnospiraceae bacterium]|nr:hypothetical protein [Lachnospiraceae bacterium]
MNYQEFLEHVQEYFTNRLTNEQTVHIESIPKNNGTFYDGLIITDPLLNISPTIYLHPFYNRLLSGTSLSKICNDIFAVYRYNLPSKNFDISNFMDFSKAKQNIVMKLINYEKNKELLKNVPYIPYLDFAIVFVCIITDFEDDYATILIQNQQLQIWEVDTQTIYQLAQTNTPTHLPHRLKPMEDVISNLVDEDFPFVDDLPMFLLTNQFKIHGATCILYSGLLEQIANSFESNFVLIPSSIHEVILIPINEASCNLSDYKQMILEVNETQLKKEEILSDHAYYYNRETKQLSF